jgi:hypothetical protein
LDSRVTLILAFTTGRKLPEADSAFLNTPVRRESYQFVGIEMRPFRILLMMILTCSMFIAVNIVPAHAAGFSISLNPALITASPGGTSNTTVTVTNNNGSPATVSLSASSSEYYVLTQFSPNPLTIANGASATSLLTLQMPGPDVICQGNPQAGPYSVSLTVQATSGSSVVASSSLAINLLSPSSALTVSVTPDKSSYNIGQTITLSMAATPSVAAQYSLRINAPDGTLWGSVQGYLPGTYTRQAQQPTGTYTATLTATYCGTASSTATFSVAPSTYDVTIAIAGLPSALNTTLNADGTPIGMMKGGDVKVLSYPIGTSHTFQVDQYISAANGHRYYIPANTWTTQNTGSFTFNYLTQYYLTLGTNPGNVTTIGLSSGWYSPGVQVQVPAVPTLVNGTTGVRYVFSQWTVDGAAVTQNGPIVTMSNPRTVLAVFKTQYRLQVDSLYGNPQGTGYYDSGSTAQFSVTSPEGVLVQQVFASWTGDYTGTSAKGSVVMDQPHTVRAMWTTSYLELYTVVGVAAVVVIVALVLLLRRRDRKGQVTKPTPPPAPLPTENPSAPAEGSPPPPAPIEGQPAVSVTCTNCGASNPLDMAYCTNCGVKLV